MSTLTLNQDGVVLEASRSRFELVSSCSTAAFCTLSLLFEMNSDEAVVARELVSHGTLTKSKEAFLSQSVEMRISLSEDVVKGMARPHDFGGGEVQFYTGDGSRLWLSRSVSQMVQISSDVDVDLRKAQLTTNPTPSFTFAGTASKLKHLLPPRNWASETSLTFEIQVRYLAKGFMKRPTNQGVSEYCFMVPFSPTTSDVFSPPLERLRVTVDHLFPDVSQGACQFIVASSEQKAGEKVLLFKPTNDGQHQWRIDQQFLTSQPSLWSIGKPSCFLLFSNKANHSSHLPQEFSGQSWLRLSLVVALFAGIFGFLIRLFA